MRWDGRIELIEKDEAEFYSFIKEITTEILGPSRLMPIFGAMRLRDMYGAWCNDLNRVGEYERRIQKGDLDHFKRASHLAFWFRRFTPLLDAADMDLGVDNPEPLTQDQKVFRDFLHGHLNEYLAFEVGLQICLYYERAKANPNPRAASLSVSMNYLETVCTVLKYKTISPHALVAIYRSLFE
jgi:hypothetical protein